MLLRAFRHTSCGSLALLVLFSFGARDAVAQAALYHSPANDGVIPAATPVLPSAGPEWLHLYADTAGSSVTTTGTACENGDGDEICGWHVSLEAAAGAELLSFSPAPNVHYALTTSALSAAGLGSSPPSVAPIWIGDLQVQSTNPAAETHIEATGLDVVTADLSVQPVALNTVVTIPVPEPGHAFGLAAGIALLIWLARIRRGPGRPASPRRPTQDEVLGFRLSRRRRSPLGSVSYPSATGFSGSGRINGSFHDEANLRPTGSSQRGLPGPAGEGEVGDRGP